MGSILIQEPTMKRPCLPGINSFFWRGCFSRSCFSRPDVNFVLLKECRGVHFGFAPSLQLTSIRFDSPAVPRSSLRLVSLLDFTVEPRNSLGFVRFCGGCGEFFSTSPRKMDRTLVFMAEAGAFQFGSRVMESVSISEFKNGEHRLWMSLPSLI